MNKWKREKMQHDEIIASRYTTNKSESKEAVMRISSESLQALNIKELLGKM